MARTGCTYCKVGRNFINRKNPCPGCRRRQGPIFSSGKFLTGVKIWKTLSTSLFRVKYIQFSLNSTKNVAERFQILSQFRNGFVESASDNETAHSDVLTLPWTLHECQHTNDSISTLRVGSLAWVNDDYAAVQKIITSSVKILVLR